MKHGVLFVFVIAAATGCTKSNDDNRPIGTGGPPGGNGNGGGGGDDDGGSTGDGGTTGGASRVCLASDPTKFTDPYTSCETGGLSLGYNLTLDADPTKITLADDGTFTVPGDIQFNPGAYWHVSGTGAVPSLVPVAQGQYVLPLISTTDYNTLAMNNGPIVPNGGAVFVHVVNSAGVPVQQVGATSVPAGATVFYDAGAGEWSNNAGAKTASTGEIWIPNIVASSVTIELVHQTEMVELSNITVVNGSNTYVTAVIK